MTTSGTDALTVSNMASFRGAGRYLQLFGREDIAIHFACVKLTELHPGRSGRDFTSAQLVESIRRVIQFWDAQQPRRITAWDYTGYWAVVLGANRSANDVVADFNLVPDENSLDAWLHVAEVEAWRAGGGRVYEIPDAWIAFHKRALAELLGAAQATHT